MSEEALFNLRWDAQRNALLGSMASLYREEAFVDTTIVADSKIFKAHKLLLSASSSYLKLILESVPSTQHAVLFMPHISSSDLGNVLNFIYDGEIKINRRSLKSFLSVAKLLRIKGMDELGDDLDISILNGPGGNLGGFNSTTLTSIPSPHGYKRPPPSDSTPLSDDLPNGLPSSSKSSMTNSPSTMRSTSPRDKDDAQSYTSTNGNGAQSNGNNVNEDVNANEENKSRRSRPPALISSNGRSTESISSQASNNESSPCEIRNGRNSTSANHDGDASPAKMRRPNSRSELEAPCDALEDESNGSRENLIIDNRKALDLHIGKFNSLHRENGSLSLEIDQDQDSHQDERSESNHHPGMHIPDQDMDDTYDDDDDDEHFSLSIQPEVSLRESDESYSLHDRRLQQFKEATLSYGGGLPFLGNSSMSITPTASNSPGWSISSAATQLSLQQQMTLKHLSKFTRPMQIPKAHGQQSGQSSPLSGGAFGGINEGILMRMMREPLQSGSSNSIKPLGSSSSGQGGFFDNPHGDPNSHLAGLRKQKRYVQCTSCSKVLSSLSALKRHMEDVHCARIQGKCLLCGRVYSSRNSLLTHVYSAHKKHHDYKAVARIIRESDFEQFATAMKTEIKQV